MSCSFWLQAALPASSWRCAYLERAFSVLRTSLVRDERFGGWGGQRLEDRAAAGDLPVRPTAARRKFGLREPETHPSLLSLLVLVNA